MNTQPSHRKVDFIIIGSMKSGTTATSAMLDQHADISIHRDKEPNYFSSNNKLSLNEYHNGFDLSKSIWGEASTDYSKHLNDNKRIVEKILEYNPDIKIIYIVRDPLERIVSDYMHLYARGYIKCDLSDALRKNPNILNRNKYSAQLEPYRKVFSDENIFVLDYQELVNDYQAFITKIQTFVGASKSKVDLASNNPSVGRQKYLAKYDRILHKTPDWFKNLIPHNIKSMVLNTMKGPSQNTKPLLSKKDIEHISQYLEDDIKKIQSEYGVLKYIDPKTLRRI